MTESKCQATFDMSRSEPPNSPPWTYTCDRQDGAHSNHHDPKKGWWSLRITPPVIDLSTKKPT